MPRTEIRAIRMSSHNSGFQFSVIKPKPNQLHVIPNYICQPISNHGKTKTKPKILSDYFWYSNKMSIWRISQGSVVAQLLSAYLYLWSWNLLKKIFFNPWGIKLGTLPSALMGYLYMLCCFGIENHVKHLKLWYPIIVFKIAVVSKF